MTIATLCEACGKPSDGEYRAEDGDVFGLCDPCLEALQPVMPALVPFGNVPAGAIGEQELQR